MYKSRIGRREQISQQEKLIEQRKQEIENKLKQREAKESLVANDVLPTNTSSTSADHKEVKEEAKCGDDSIESSPTSSSASVNRFANDGSFFEQFLKMQKSEPKAEPKAEPKEEPTEATKCETTIIKPIKMVVKDIKENKSKLIAVHSIEDSTVRLDVDVDDDHKVSPPEDKDIVSAIEKTAISVIINGSAAEETMRQSMAQNNSFSWLNDKESDNYQYFQRRVHQLSEAKDRAQSDNLISDSDESKDESNKEAKRQRKSRWGEHSGDVKPDLALVQYAIQVFGNIDLSAEQWKQLEDQRKMRMLFEMLQNKQKANQRLVDAGKVKYEYDSDEDTTDGTWEHKRRRQEMTTTSQKAQQLTDGAAGKHHIGDFMPPEELEKFMQKWESLKEGTPLCQESDYQDSKIESDNVGFQMLKKLGWVEGQGLGSNNSGISDPINKSSAGPNNAGLGQTRPEDLREGDDEYEAYRKRMMLAYRFRPNPLNNPRRTYY